MEQIAEVIGDVGIFIGIAILVHGFLVLFSSN